MQEVKEKRKKEEVRSKREKLQKGKGFRKKK